MQILGRNVPGWLRRGIAILISALPVCLIAFGSSTFGQLGWGLGLAQLMAIVALLFGPPFFSAIASFFVKPRPAIEWIACVGFLYLFCILSFPRSNISNWLEGYAAHLRRTKNPDRIQQWASEILAKHESGELNVVTNKLEYPSQEIDVLLVADEEIPKHILRIRDRKPRVQIAEFRGGWMHQLGSSSPNAHANHLTTNTCVSLQWNAVWLLAGRPDFRTDSPGDPLEVAPGIYLIYFAR